MNTQSALDSATGFSLVPRVQAASMERFDAFARRSRQNDVVTFLVTFIQPLG
jgi:hypothetical protein